MEKKNLLDLNLQLFGEEVADVEVSEAVEPTEETTEADETETVENDGSDAPQEQSAEENARYAAIRRRAEEDARKRYEAEIGNLNQQVAAMCQGITHPITGAPITNIRDYMDALQIQQRQASEAELEEKGIDPSVIERMIASNPVVMQAQQVLNSTRQREADAYVEREIADLSKYDPNIRSMADIVALPTFPRILERLKQGMTLTDAYKTENFDNYMSHTNEAARQKAINQMRGKAHLPSQPNSVATENDGVEVPPEIMSSWKSEGKTEKQIRDLYSQVAKKLHLN